MLYKIADLFVEVPAAGGMASRCREYQTMASADADIVIRSELYRREKYPEGTSEELIAYMESAIQFFTKLLSFDGVYLHASCVRMGDRAYLFSADSGVGKSTHTRLWQKTLGESVQIFNDDKPALRRLDGRWYAYGLPWCGKDGININMKVPLAGICFLKQDEQNEIRRLTSTEAIQRLMPQTLKNIKSIKKLDVTLNNFDKLIREIPIFELKNRPEPEAALLSYETMRRAAEEAGL